ncbi:Ig-like domain-containing protein [Vibrio maritimus]|uniref:Ig-like domain-containing protein n=1 Tax=Vibrio maritimus TaxID=990268 RepID=UPI0040697D5F
MHKILFTTIVVLFISFGARADVVEFSFVDTNNDQRHTSAQGYINPSSDVSVLLSAGLDRRVRLTVRQQDGGVVYQRTSEFITVDDRISDSVGNVYYGVVFDVQKRFLIDGTYNFTQDILDFESNVTGSVSYDVVVDTSSPSASALINNAGGYNMVTTGPVWSLGYGGSGYALLIVEDIADESGIESVAVNNYRQDGSLHVTAPMQYDAANNVASRTFETGVFPRSNLDEDFMLEVVIVDKAGNRYVSDRQVARMDNDRGTVELWGFYNPSASGSIGPGLDGFERYQSGMVVHTNPVVGAYRVKKSNWRSYNYGGLVFTNGLGENRVAGEDDEYVYIVFSAPYGNTNGNYIRFVNQHEWSGHGVGYNVTLSDAAPKTPYLVNVHYNFSDVGWRDFYRYYVDVSSLPVSVSGVRGYVEARSYTQRFVHFGKECFIPPGETFCEFDIDYTMQDGTLGYLHGNATVYDPSNALRSNPRWGETHWNGQYYPQITSVFDEVNKTMTAYIKQLGRGHFFDRLRLNGAWLIDQNTGETLNVSGGKIAEDRTDYTYRWDLTSLPEGQFTIAVKARENHGATTVGDTFEYNNDKSPPVISFELKDGEVYEPGMLVKGLERIRLRIDDNSAYQFTKLNLSGGPSNDNVELAFNDQGENVYGLEYPRTFPTNAGEDYKLTVTVTDAFGQVQTQVYQFAYEPDNFFKLDAITSVPHNRPLADIYNKPHSLITSNTLRADNGQLASGEQRLFITVRADADYSLNFNGVVVRPGETKEMYVSLDDNGQLNLPVSALEDVHGQANYMIEITGIR